MRFLPDHSEIPATNTNILASGHCIYSLPSFRAVLNSRNLMEYAEYCADLGGWVIWRCDHGDTIRVTEPESTEQEAWEAYWQIDGRAGLYKGFVFH